MIKCDKKDAFIPEQTRKRDFIKLKFGKIGVGIDASTSLKSRNRPAAFNHRRMNRNPLKAMLDSLHTAKVRKG